MNIGVVGAETHTAQLCEIVMQIRGQALPGAGGRAGSPGVRSFVRMFRTGRTGETMESTLVPVAVLEALEKSLASGGRVRVS